MLQSGFLLHFQAWPSVGFLLPPVLTLAPCNSARQGKVGRQALFAAKSSAALQPSRNVHEPGTVSEMAFSSVDELDVNQSMTTLTFFQCKICGKKFKKKEYLRDHLNIHAGRKCYACNYCGESFMHRASMARHRLKCKLSPRNQLPLEGIDENDIL